MTDELSPPDQEWTEDEAPPGEGDEESTAPTFILFLAGESFALELDLLRQWVDDLLVPTYVREPSPTAPWCLRWWEHDEVLARLHALWLAWQEQTDPEAGGWTGPSTWHRDHLDPTLREVRAPDGPLWRCMSDPDKDMHRVNVVVGAEQSLSLEPSGFAPA
ncbi:DUF4913 domain-containing protein [Nonomuraea sp. NPDC049695]|uniref:DUF4913 domain-containing protein n=1 Tax=Nonomuraea sp. NPDC049695 TaxID=3154734 RepID=UPI0034168BD8